MVTLRAYLEIGAYVLVRVMEVMELACLVGRNATSGLIVVADRLYCLIKIVAGIREDDPGRILLLGINEEGNRLGALIAREACVLDRNDRREEFVVMA